MTYKLVRIIDGEETVYHTGTRDECISWYNVADYRQLPGEWELREYELVVRTENLPEIFEFPIPGDAVSCGLRLDRPKKQRHHSWVPLGTDFKNKGLEGIVEVDVRACHVCGKDDR